MARMRMFFNRWQAVSAADVLGSVFIVQRHLLPLLRTHVLAGSGLTAELAEILIELYLAEARLTSPEHADTEGYISFRALLAALGYSPGLLSRRIAWLSQRRWIETKRAEPNAAAGLHGNCQKVRITALGKNKIGPVWEQYEALAELLLAGISPSDLGTHYRINELISDKLCAPRFLANGGPPDESKSPPPRPTKVSARKAANRPTAPVPPMPVPVKEQPTAKQRPLEEQFFAPQGDFLD